MGKRIRITALGGCKVYVDGRLIADSGTKKPKLAWVALAFFTLHPRRRISVPELIHALYTEEKLVKYPTTTVKKLVSQLRHELQADAGDSRVIEVKNGRYFLAPDIHVSIDSAQLEKLCASARAADADACKEIYEKIHGLYQGTFLPRAENCPWVILEQQRVLQLYVDCCRTCALKLLKAQACEEAAQIYDEIIHLDFFTRADLKNLLEVQDKISAQRREDFFFHILSLLRRYPWSAWCENKDCMRFSTLRQAIDPDMMLQIVRRDLLSSEQLSQDFDGYDELKYKFFRMMETARPFDEASACLVMAFLKDRGEKEITQNEALRLFGKLLKLSGVRAESCCLYEEAAFLILFRGEARAQKFQQEAARLLRPLANTGLNFTILQASISHQEYHGGN